MDISLIDHFRDPATSDHSTSAATQLEIENETTLLRLRKRHFRSPDQVVGLLKPLLSRELLCGVEKRPWLGNSWLAAVPLRGTMNSTEYQASSLIRTRPPLRLASVLCP